ncbi:MFS transporter [Kineosporia rhizophila]|uniref:MFS transporter n=1 Tax=Kineosporia TaxID=49184 RepID=UPI001E3B08A5|nr:MULTISPECIES: MFS transporter [Kineosporia]MCE0537885.1 MFS transporter [Kineosporia rhizophila]
MRGRRVFGTLLGAVLVLGIADSLSQPYLALFAAVEAGMQPFQVGVLASATGLGGIVISTWLGHRFDRAPTRFYIVLACLGGAAGYALLTVTRGFWPLLLLSLTLLGVVAVAFPQLFALARQVMGDSEGARWAAPVLRSGWSLAWALGPLLGALILARYSFSGLFWASAAVLLGAALMVLVVPMKVGPGQVTATEAVARVPLPRAPIVLLTLGVALFFTSMIAGSLVLPFYVTDELDLPASRMGLLFSACAAVEVVVALGLALIPPDWGRAWLVPGGMLLMTGYFAITMLSQDLTGLLLGQIARGAAIAVVGAAGIVYFQDVMAPAVGRATTLFSNATTAGVLGAGLLAGSWLEVFSYRWSLALCGATALLGAVAFAWGGRQLSNQTEDEGTRPVEPGPLVL